MDIAHDTNLRIHNPPNRRSRCRGRKSHATPFMHNQAMIPQTSAIKLLQDVILFVLRLFHICGDDSHANQLEGKVSCDHHRQGKCSSK